MDGNDRTDMPFFPLFLRTDAYQIDSGSDLLPNVVYHFIEDLKAFDFILGQRILLSVAAQVYSLAQRFHVFPDGRAISGRRPADTECG